MPAKESEAADPLAELQASVREQLEAAWQLHVDHVEQELEKGWHEQIACVLEERFAEIAATIERLAEQRIDARLAEAQIAWARTITEKLNLAARRVWHAEDEKEVARALVDVSAGFAERVMLLRVAGGRLRLDGAVPPAGTEAEVALEKAPALRHAVESKDPTFAIPSAGELSDEIARLTLATPENKIALFPVVSRGTTAAVLCAQGGEDFHALELLVTVAARALDAVAPAETKDSQEPASTGAARRADRHVSEGWARLSRQDQEKHLRAQRYARVHVAELRLYKSQAVKAGRAEHNIYEKLRAEIDAGRAIFEQEHLADCPSMVDYYHLEIVRTLANDDESLLGPEYPGPLV